MKDKDVLHISTKLEGYRKKMQVILQARSEATGIQLKITQLLKILIDEEYKRCKEQ